MLIAPWHVAPFEDMFHARRFQWWDSRRPSLFHCKSTRKEKANASLTWIRQNPNLTCLERQKKRDTIHVHLQIIDPPPHPPSPVSHLHPHPTTSLLSLYLQVTQKMTQISNGTAHELCKNCRRVQHLPVVVSARKSPGSSSSSRELTGTEAAAPLTPPEWD